MLQAKCVLLTQAQNGIFKVLEELTSQMKIALIPTASLRVFFGINSRYGRRSEFSCSHVCVLSLDTYLKERVTCSLRTQAKVGSTS